MWSAKIIGKSKSRGTITLKVEYTDGTEVFSEDYVSSAGANAEWLKNIVRGRIQGYESAYAFADSLSLESAVDTTAPAAPTQAEQDLKVFVEKYQRWCSVKRAIDAGILTGNETQVQNLLNDVKTLFKPAYLAYI